jgi:hypothetical protein
MRFEAYSQPQTLLQLQPTFYLSARGGYRKVHRLCMQGEWPELLVLCLLSAVQQQAEQLHRTQERAAAGEAPQTTTVCG